ncbi:MAG: T9SS type A sorting domain-containing protein [Ignavibacteria bacterium]|jgi:hypothetical protein|nr:T9SS type A sorting domain-containing protein [Ignavibacteria bacterium]
MKLSGMSNQHLLFSAVKPLLLTIRKSAFTILLLFLIAGEILPQSKMEDKKALLKRAAMNLPEVKSSPQDGAPGYCAPGSHSTTYESINSVKVKETFTGIEITVVVNITNPYGCVANNPCQSYDASPENINVWIDWDGDKTWGNRPDEYVIHEGMKGYAIGFDSHLMTLIKDVKVPADAKRPAWMRVNLGWGYDPTDPCQADWTYGDVKDYPILWGLNITEISAIGNIELKDVPKPLLSQKFDKDGKLTDPPVVNKPLAAAARKSEIKLNVKLQSFPDDKLGANSRTVCNYKITSQWKTYVEDVSEFKEKEGKLAIKLPDRIGKYNLELNFKFYGDNQNQVGSDIYILELWVSYDDPKLSGIKKVWMDKAIEFTEGTMLSPDAEEKLAQEMMHGIYNKGGMRWSYGNAPIPWFRWYEIVEGKTEEADCKATSNVWMNLLKTLGVGGTSTVHHQGKIYGKGFLSKTNLVAYGGTKSARGNAFRSAEINSERWFFDSHTFGQKGTVYYDPVFDKSFKDFYFHVAWDIRTEFPGGYETGNPPPDQGPRVLATGESFELEDGRWKKYTYEFIFTPKIHPLIQSPITDGARFTGVFSEKTVNTDGDAYTDQLGADVEIEITKSGKYMVSGLLRQNDIVLATQPYTEAPGSWYEVIGAAPGKLTVHPTFSGESIFQKKLNGTYTFDLYILDTTGTIVDSAEFKTGQHQYTEFGEIPLRVSQISESPEDTTGDGLYDVISVKLDIQSSLAGSYLIQSTLLKDSISITSASMPFQLIAGDNQIIHKAGARALSAAGQDGPYTISVQLCSADGAQLTADQIQTAAYKASQFAPPEAVIITGTNEYTKDDDNDGLIDTLQAELQLTSLKDSRYIVTAYLTSQKDSLIAVSSSEVSAIKGYSLVRLNFAGTAIAKSKTDGPYKIGYAVILDTVLNLVSSGFNLYNTQAYTINQFEQPRGKIIQSTGSYTEKLIDTDNNGLTDSLEIDVEVIPLDSGYVVAMGQLMNSEGESVCRASGRDFLPANEKGNVRLKFSGRMLYGNLSDGPYDLKNLLIYHLGIPEESISIENAFKTSDYKYLSFEKASVVTGHITDVNNKPVKGVLLSLGDSTYDYSEPTGKYHLVSMQEGQFLLKIYGPDTTGLIWNIYLGDKLFTGDSLIVNVSADTVLNVNFKAPVVLSDAKSSIRGLTALPYYELMQNYPNPFNPSTTIRYNIPKAGVVRLEIFDMLGKKIATLVDEYQAAGMHERMLQADKLASGIYYYQIRSGSYMAAKKMILVK